MSKIISMKPQKDSRSVYLYGSCVSRDTAEFFDPVGLVLGGYTARQSLISAFGPKAITWRSTNISKPESPFQRRSVENDLHGSLPLDLIKKAGSTNLIVCDLIDERNGVLQCPDGAILTNSLELQNSDCVKGTSKDTKHLKFGTDSHFETWETCLDSYIEFLQSIDMIQKLIFLKVFWASESAEGHTFPFGESRLDPHRMNQLTDRYYLALESRKVALLEVPKELCVTTASHKWGIAPFHFVPEFYSYVAKGLRRYIDEPTT